MCFFRILGRKQGRDGGRVKSLYTLCKSRSRPPSPPPQAVFYDGGQWEERKGRFVLIMSVLTISTSLWDGRVGEQDLPAHNLAN